VNLLRIKYFKQIIIIITFSLSVGASAQVSLKGRVLDTANTGMSFITVALLDSKDSSIINGNVSNDNGEYIFQRVIKGKYLIRAVFIGYEDIYSKVIEVDTTDILLPDMTIASKGLKLDEISIVAVKQSIEFKNGITVMNVENSAIAAGNTVLDLLKKIPGVYIDNQNNISLNGNKGVRIMLDGKLQQISNTQLMSILSSMSAETVSKIEVMKNPPVKYDAGGSAGMINIISKKVRVLGYSGNSTLGLSMGQKFRGGDGASLNYKGKKLTIFTNLNYSYRFFYDKYTFDKTINSGVNNVTSLNQNGVTTNLQKAFAYKIGASYDISSKTSIGISFNDAPSSSASTDNANNYVGGYNNLGFDHLSNSSTNSLKWHNPTFNISGEHQFDTLGTKLSVSVDYANYGSTGNNYNQNYFLNTDNVSVLPENIFRSIGISSINIYTQKVDFQKDIFKSIHFETGAKNTIVNSNNNFNFEQKDAASNTFINNPTYTNKYNYRENIIAGYLNFSKEVKNGSIQLGVRAENTIAKGNNLTNGFLLTRNYINLFPNLSYDYSKSEKHAFQFNYNRRIDRPDYSQLNPFKSYQDQFVSSMGNPYLLPQYSDNISFSYIFKGMIYQTLTFSHISKYILDVSSQNDSTKETIQTVQNITGNTNYTYTLFMQKQIRPWFSTQLTGSLIYQEFYGAVNNTNLRNSTLAYNIYMNNEFVLPKEYKIQFTGQYIGPSIYGYTTVKSRWSIDIAIKKTFRSNWVISAGVLDLFHKDIERLAVKFDNQNYQSKTISDTFRFKLSLSYKFGNMKIAKKSTGSNADEEARLKNKLKSK